MNETTIIDENISFGKKIAVSFEIDGRFMINFCTNARRLAKLTFVSSIIGLLIKFFYLVYYYGIYHLPIFSARSILYLTESLFTVLICLINIRISGLLKAYSHSLQTGVTLNSPDQIATSFELMNKNMLYSIIGWAALVLNYVFSIIMLLLKLNA